MGIFWMFLFVLIIILFVKHRNLKQRLLKRIEALEQTVRILKERIDSLQEDEPDIFPGSEKVGAEPGQPEAPEPTIEPEPEPAPDIDPIRPHPSAIQPIPPSHDTPEAVDAVIRSAQTF